jgi:serine/threonine protein kinase/class 3 adenylate cyclase
MDCTSCGHSNRPERKFCTRCGAALAVVCAGCHGSNLPDDEFCGECGDSLRDRREAAGEGTRQTHASKLPTSFAGGRYTVRGFLGEGSKKLVYRAHDVKLDRDVAFALIKTSGLDADGTLRVRREAQAMGRLGDHPHIVTIYDTGEEDGAPFIVSQHMAGGSVEALLAGSEHHRIGSAHAVEIGVQICAALQHAHARGIVHRDLKPGNVWLDEDGNAGLGDFGLAVALDRSRMTMQGVMVGTVAYMAPEQALGHDPDARSDLYALGAMLYEMVAGRPPFLGEDAVAIISQHINTAPVAPAWHEPSVQPELESLILQLLAKSPEERPQSAESVGEILRVIAQRSTVADEPLPQQERITDLRRLDWGRFVGRQKELELLKSHLEATLSGTASIVLVAGEPGIGKTRLVEEFAVYAGLRGAQVLTGRSYEGEQTVPYRPFIEALRQYVRTMPNDELRQQMGAAAPEVATMVSEIRQRFPDIAPAPQLDADAERMRLFDSLTAFLASASAARPIVLFFDDLHWADKPSLLLLQHVLRHSTSDRVMVLATYRDVEVERAHPLAEALTVLRRLPGFSRVALRGLPRECVEAMLESIDAGEESTLQRQALAQALHEETEGNPFFIREVLSHLVEEGMIVRQGGRWVGRVSSISDLRIPESVRDVIGRRLTRLSEPCNRMLTRASTILRGFTWDALRAINPQTGEEELVDLLEEALAAQLIAPGRDDASVVYDFTHALIRHTLYDELSGPRRVLLHRQIGTALEELYAANVDPHVGELAYHFYQAAPGGDVQKAIDYSLLAGDRAMALHGHEDAVTHFERAMQATELAAQDDEGQRAGLLVRLGHSLWHSGRFDDARQRFGEAAEIAQRSGDAALLVEAAVGYSGNIASFAAGVVDRRLIELLESALGALDENDSEERAIVMAALASALSFDRPSRERVRELIDAAESAARRLADPRVLARVLTYRHWALASPANPHERRDIAEEILRLAAEAGDLQLELQGWLWRSLDDVELGELSSATAAAGHYLRRVEEVRSPYYRWFGVIWDGMLALLGGRFDDAEALAQQALAIGQGTGNANAFQIFGAQMAFVRLEQKRLGEIEPVLRAAVDQNPDIPAWRCALAMVYGELGRTHDAHEIIAELSRDDCAAIPRDLVFLVAMAILAIPMRIINDPVIARSLYAAARDYGDSVVVMPGLATGPLHDVLGNFATAADDWTAAEVHFEKAHRIAQTLEAPYAIGLTRIDHARMLLRRDRPGDRACAVELLNLALDAAQENNWPRLVDIGLGLKLQAQGIATATNILTSLDAVAVTVQADRPDMREHAAADGTVTIMFSDIEGSTELAEQLGDDGWLALLRAHDRTVRACIAEHGGHEVKHLGDGFMITFQSARRAAHCAQAIQQSLERKDLPEPVRVRIGIHAGDAIRDDEDFFGRSVIVASRIAAQAAGGEVLVSGVVKELIAGASDLRFDGGRDVELKGLEGTQRVYVLGL